MTETITRSFVVTTDQMSLIKDKAQKIGGLSDSAALRVIIREWAEMSAAATRPAISPKSLEAQLREARENLNEAIRAAARTTVDEGFSVAQWQEASRKADIAQKVYNELWAKVDAIKTKMMLTFADEPDDSPVDEDTDLLNSRPLPL